MKFATLCLSILIASAFGVQLLADDEARAPAPGGFGMLRQPKPAIGPTTNVDYDRLPLSVVIESLQKTEPSFQAVIRSDSASSDAGNPAITLHLKNVTVNQVMEVLAEKYGWSVDRAGNPPIYVIGVRASQASNFSVTAYCLTPIVEELADEKKSAGHQGGGGIFPDRVPTTQEVEEMRKRRGAAMADIVATVETAVKLASDGEPATIQIHEPTGMLILQANSTQRQAAETVLRAEKKTPVEPIRAAHEVSGFREGVSPEKTACFVRGSDH